MDKKEGLRETLSRFKRKLQKTIDVDQVILFGSRATGEAGKYSDVDLIVVSEDFKGKGHFERAKKMYDHWDSKLPVDFLCYTPEEFKRLSDQVSIVREALRSGETIGG